ncbi:MAG: phosphoribosylanthranilate isomerase [Okeania sp. SIO3B3]|nr:phosphoribosylanthranilate isomerase [Okeania sp. SIO3B3]
MKQTTKPRVKICCISSIEEAKMAIIYGASALGLVSAMPSGPGVIYEELIAKISAIVPPGVSTFLLTSKQDVKSIIEQQRRCQVNTIQICDYLTLGKYQDLRDAMPGIALVQVIHVTGEESVKEAVEVSPLVDAILLDSGNQSLAIKQLGGTGKVHNWDISKKIRELVDVPVYLAGGLNSENVTAAIQQVSPFGLDICTGVRTNNKLDEMKLSKFFSQIYYSSFAVDEVQNFRE